MARRSAPRIFCITATEAPIVAVLRRGPSAWHHLGRWDLDALTYESGAWIRAQLYPQKCDLSPDGRWFSYSVLDMRADWAAGTIYEAISRLPWLHALAAWEMGTTYTRGIHFVGDKGDENGDSGDDRDENGAGDRGDGNGDSGDVRTSPLGEPDVGDDGSCLRKYGIAITRPGSFAVERRRWWVVREDTPARDKKDIFDERRAERVRMRKAQPGGEGVLEVEGSYAAFRDIPHLRTPAQYTLTVSGAAELLDVQWADWDARGRLLVATSEGRLQVRELRNGGAEVVFDQDVASMKPEPVEAPGWAKEW